MPQASTPLVDFTVFRVAAAGRVNSVPTLMTRLHARMRARKCPALHRCLRLLLLQAHLQQGPSRARVSYTIATTASFSRQHARRFRLNLHPLSIAGDTADELISWDRLCASEQQQKAQPAVRHDHTLAPPPPPTSKSARSTAR